MKLSYWGHFKEVLNSEYIEFINYFVQEKRNVPNAISEYAKHFNIPLYQVETRNDLACVINEAPEVDAVIVGGFGLILTKSHIDLLKGKIVNIHPGILPECRGRHPLPSAILNNDEYMGMTAHVLTEKIDFGNIVGMKKMRINYDQSYRENERVLLDSFVPLFNEVVLALSKGEVEFLSDKALDGNYHNPLSADELNRIFNCSKLKDLR